MAKLGEEDPRWIVRDMSTRADKHNVGNWYSSERDMLKEGTERLGAMLENVEQSLTEVEDMWQLRVMKLASCEGEIIFFDRTVNGVRKPTTVVDVQVKLEWEATLDSVSKDDSRATLGGVATCSELSLDALAEGLVIETRVTDGHVATSTSQDSVRAAVTASLTKLLDSVGRAFFEDLHNTLDIPPPRIAASHERMKLKPSRPKHRACTDDADDSTRSSSTANPKRPANKEERPRKQKNSKKAGAKASTTIVACIAAGAVLIVGLWAWRNMTAPGARSPTSNSREHLPPPTSIGSRIQSGGSSGSHRLAMTKQAAGTSADPTTSLLNLLSPQAGPTWDLQNVR